MVLGDKFQKRIDTYREDFIKYGYGPMALAMPSDRRTIRYYELIKNFPFAFFGGGHRDEDVHFSILDAGCGFGDMSYYLNKRWSNFSYYGIDAVEEFIVTAKMRYGAENVCFEVMNYVNEDLPSDFEFDYAVSSQTFNDLYTSEDDNYAVIEDVIYKLFRQCNRGVAFNFVTDKVQYKKEGIAYHSPEKILSMAYKLSNEVILDNSCMPFECTCTILKDQASDGMIFDMFREKHAPEFVNGTFVVNKKMV